MQYKLSDKIKFCSLIYMNTISTGLAFVSLMIHKPIWITILAGITSLITFLGEITYIIFIFSEKSPAQLKKASKEETQKRIDRDIKELDTIYSQESHRLAIDEIMNIMMEQGFTQPSISPSSKGTLTIGYSDNEGNYFPVSDLYLPAGKLDPKSDTWKALVSKIKHDLLEKIEIIKKQETK